MSTKSEERIKKILNQNIENHISEVNERIGGVFLFGLIAGIILSYSGFLSYFFGICTGVMINTKYKYISYQISSNGGILFNKIIKYIK